LRAWFFAVVIAMVLIAPDARAAEPARIAVVHELSADARAIGRLRDELSTLGLEVVDVTLAPTEGATALDDAARRVGAFAAVHVVPAKGGVEVWIADQTSGKTLFRELVVAPGETFDDVAALKAVELLRASLAELGFSLKPREEVRPTQPVTPTPPPTPTPPEPARLFLELGPALAMSPGGVGATGHAFVGLRWRAFTAFGIDVFSALPITAARVAAAEGSAEVRPWLFGLDGAVWFFDPNADWQVAAAGGIGLAYLAIQGDPTPPLMGRSDATTIALPFARFSLDRRLGERFRLGFQALVGVAAPRPAVQFDGREVADWGRPLVLSTLELGIALD
jgi:hypothetical protein